MKALIEKLGARIDAFAPRERVVIFMAGSVAILLGWYLLFGEAESVRHDRFRSERDSLTVQVADVQARIAQQVAPVDASDPRARLEELRRRSASVDDMIQDYAAELISPTEMARLLERVLERRQSLNLHRISNLGAEDMLPDDTPGQHRLYRHGLVLELEGPYLALLAYLEDLEALPWRLYWQVLEVDAAEYPVNRVLIEVATLSLHEDWIGV